MPAVIKIYTANFCPYCAEIKSTLKSKGFQYEETIVDTPQLREHLLEVTKGRRTLPQIFINENHIGGFNDFKQFENDGDLDKLNEMQA